MNKIVKMIHSNRQLRKNLIEEAIRSREPSLSEQAINEWAKLRKGVPATRVKLVARVTGLPLHVIRPDVFPRP